MLEETPCHSRWPGHVPQIDGRGSMCGIAGLVVTPERSLPHLPDCLGAMAQSMAQRGPDDEGTFAAEDLRSGRASRRLARPDLLPAGHVSIANEDGTVWISHNGEICNAQEMSAEQESQDFPFQSPSDTKVVLRGYRL